ncbi:E3 ubiquitin-protein ligase MARCH6 [Lingula anatina]|uniref:RING-type E3 ubiquitin transferase n=1 Tax=Lingula anatina TaxID=7574 RepID=A0A1S3HEE7_LINAN|nr:E3 ubiquitin-protein ligase MARCH6 [Lingula anatina]|eukprot:XP_013384428.2 E3 ubiquitin-protein ligase MARCH6 [Lingula anatina]
MNIFCMFLFQEHVFWVVSLNTLFILVFAFCPYHIGHFTIMGIKVNELVQASQFEGLVTTLTGYTVIALSLVVLHTLAALVKFNKSKRIIGLCYLVVKVALLVVVEIGIFPLICGWWLDICSLAMFDATLKDREKSFSNAPGTSMFIHWLVGMVYVFYFASFILLLREVLRPGVLWFLRNLNDPEFNPIQEMIHLPVLRHMRRFLASMVIFGTTVLLMLWLPVQLIKKMIPGFLPYHIMLSSDAPVSELSLELLLLQVVLPALLEQGHTRTWLKGLVRGWTVGVAWLLDLKSYLLGDSPEDTDGAERVAPNIILPAQPGQQGAAQAVQEELGNQGAAQEAEHQGGAEEAVDLLGHQGAALQAVNLLDHQEAAQNVEAPVGAVQHGAGHQGAAHGAAGHQGAVHGAAGHQVAAHGAAGHQGAAQAVGNLGAIHQALLHQGGPSGYQPFHKPSFFFIRMMLLFVLMWSTLFLASLVTLILPVFFGRMLMSLWMGSVRIHELYTAACGLYVCWVVLRLGAVLYQWIPQGWAAIMTKVKEWTLLALKSLMIAFLLIGVAPLLLGLLFELVVVAPLRVPLNQTPVFFPWQDWALGVLHAKIICAVTMMGPQWWLKNVMERVYNDGLRNMNLTFILTNLCIPVIGCLSMSLAAPYVVAKSIVPMFGVDFETENLVYRRIYPSLLTLLTFVGFCTMQVKQFRKLYEHIKNDKYLVGQRLVNYTRPES